MNIIEKGLINMINPIFFVKTFIGSENLNILLKGKGKKYFEKIGIDLNLKDKNIVKNNRLFYTIPTIILWSGQIIQTKFKIINWLKFYKLSGGTHLFLGFISIAIVFIFNSIESKKIITPDNKIEISKKIKFEKVYFLADYIDNNYEKLKSMHVPCLYGINEYGDIILKDMVDWPHALGMGQTGGGKSCLLNSLLQSSMYFRSNILYIMNDFKFGLELDQYSKFDNVIIIEELQKLNNILENLQNLIKNRAGKFKNLKCKDIFDYNCIVVEEKKEPFIVFIIDEFAELKLNKDKDLVKNVNSMITENLNKYRALGVIFLSFLQRASKDEMSISTRAKMPETFCTAVEGEDAKFVGIDSDLTKGLRKGEFINKNKTFDNQKIKGFFIQSNPSRKEIKFSNEVFEKIHKRCTGENFQYSVPENLKRKKLDKNFSRENTKNIVIETRNFLLNGNGKNEGVPEINLNKKPTILDKNKPDIVKNNENIYLKYIKEKGCIPSVRDTLKDLNLSLKQLKTIKLHLWKKGLIKKGKNGKNQEVFLLESEIK